MTLCTGRGAKPLRITLFGVGTIYLLEQFLWGDRFKARQGKARQQERRNEVLNERVERRETWFSADLLPWGGKATTNKGASLLKNQAD